MHNPPMKIPRTPTRNADRIISMPAARAAVNKAPPAIAPSGPTEFTKAVPVPRTRVGNDSPMKKKKLAAGPTRKKRPTVYIVSTKAGELGPNSIMA